MPLKHQPEAKQMVEELAAMKAELLAMQRELDKDNSTKEDITSDAAKFIAAVIKVDLPLFWDADPVLWLCQCEPVFCHTCTISSGVKIDLIVGKLPKALSLPSSSFLLIIRSRTRKLL
jgi:hypothetical protein